MWPAVAPVVPSVSNRSNRTDGAVSSRPLDLSAFPLSLRALLHPVEIVEVARYLGAQSNRGICAPRDSCHHFTLGVQNDHLCGTPHRLTVRAQLHIDANL